MAIFHCPIKIIQRSKEQAGKPEGKESILLQLWQARQEMDSPDSRYGKIKDLKEQAALYSLLQGGGITTMRQLHEKISAMNKNYYDLRGKIVSAERRIKALDEHLSMWEQYEKNKSIRRPVSGKTEIRRGGSHPEEMEGGIGKTGGTEGNPLSENAHHEGADQSGGEPAESRRPA